MMDTHDGHEGKEFLTVKEVAAWLDLDEMTIYRLVRRGELPCHQIGRTKRFRRTEIERYLTQVRTGRRDMQP